MASVRADDDPQASEYAGKDPPDDSDNDEGRTLSWMVFTQDKSPPADSCALGRASYSGVLVCLG